MIIKQQALPLPAPIEPPPDPQDLAPPKSLKSPHTKAPPHPSCGHLDDPVSLEIDQTKEEHDETP